LDKKKSGKNLKAHSIMMVAGEVSGDMHAAGVIRALRAKNPKLKIFGMGGPQMAKAGMDSREDLTKQALIGFWEVLKHFPMIKRRFDQCVGWLREEKPDLLVLVDYPGFNLRLARKAHQLGVPVVYYIAPKVWVWNESRVELMRKVIRKLLVIFPFEENYFKQRGLDALYVGNPSGEAMEFKPLARSKALFKLGRLSSAFPLVCAMPGSRKGELKRIWPVFLEGARLFLKTYPRAVFLVPKAPGVNPEDYPGLQKEDPFVFVQGPAYDLRQACDLAWVKSGTGTLETALLGTPMVVAYKVAALSAFLAKRFIKIENYSLVNLLAGKRVVPELLQDQANPSNLVAESRDLLENRKARESQLKAFAALGARMGSGRASQKAALEILGLLAKK